MKRASVAAAVLTVAMATLSGCGGGSEYCDTVEANKDKLNNFGQTRTDKAYEQYADLMTKIAKVAPKDVKKDWSTLASTTTDVREKANAMGVKMEELTDKKKLTKVTDAQAETYNEARLAFNGTTKERAAVVKNVKQECKLTLK